KMISAVRNHFYFGAETCDGNLDKLSRSWHSILKHVLNDHTSCCHQISDSPGGIKQGLTSGSLPFVSLKDFVTSNFTKDFKYYIRFRSSADLESFHNVILKYASKRIGYRKGYSLRVWLAVLDWNNNRGRNTKYTTSKISRRTKKRIS